MKESENNLLFDKLNRFINKYYKNKILKGLIFLLSSLLIFLLFFSFIEYFSRLSSFGRGVLFWIYCSLNLIILIKFIVVPLTQLLRIGKTISFSDAAKIIGRHFPEIDDKILNILQLNELSDSDNLLIQASITQKTESIQSFSFSNSINFKENKKHLKWIAVPSLLIFLFFITGNKHIITASSARIVDHNTEYDLEAPFKFIINNKKLEIIQQEDFELDIDVEGSKIPNNIYIEIENNRFSLKKNDFTNFRFLFKNVVSDINFKLYADGFYSESFCLKTIQKPNILEFNTILHYPAYTKKKNEILSNIGDLIIPEGTIVSWGFEFKNTDSLYFLYKNKLEKHKVINDSISIQKTLLEDETYFVSVSNENIKSTYTQYDIQVLIDEFPNINLEANLDSANNILYFEGIVSDDYAISKLEFNYEIIRNDTSLKINENLIVNHTSSENYYHFLDIQNLNLAPSDEINYYFEVWDNDKVNGHKSKKSFIGKHKELSEDKLKEQRDEESKKVKNGMDKSIELAKAIEKDIEELKKSLIEKKSLGWEERKKAENIIKKHKNLENQIQKNNIKNYKKNLTNEKLNTSILKKQKQLEDLMDKVLDDESKKLMQELQDLLEEMNKKEMKDVLDRIDQENTDLEKELDRNLELYKELEFEQKLEETIEKIENIKERQIELKKETEDKNSNTEDLSKIQDKLQKDFQKLEEEIKNLEKKNSDLEDKKNLPKTEEEQKQASKSMEESKSSLDKKQKNKSSKKQEKVIEKLEEISEKMAGLQSSCSNDKPMENMETLRQILENLITLSFNQEELIHNISSIPKNSTNIVKYIKEQKKLSENSKIIEDSLFALSKRVIQIESLINKEISAINYNIDKSISLLEERKVNQGLSKQQFTMTSVNNLALLLSETLKQMQMDMANKTPGSKQCNKPGSSSKPSLKELKKMQESLKNEMKGKSGNEGEKGKKKGENKSEEGESRRLMQMAQKQQQIRQRLQEIRDEIGESGEKGNIDRILEKMEENEIDILNNKISNESLLRQEEILTRLLEAEESQKERGEEEKRESIEWNYEIKNNNSEYLEYIQKKKEQEELLKTTPLQLNPFYKEKVNRYFNTISEK
ncbi:MAG: hypothetical protein CMD02_03260 [Flavobacteriales bacterium]|nr:hypothetical protein [Flavobacteriales bacterium]|tara:strand:+ start:5425 stop:8730 length:3306 start_codon:yes stop_codon:yes gene_type:complete